MHSHVVGYETRDVEDAEVSTLRPRQLDLQDLGGKVLVAGLSPWSNTHVFFRNLDWEGQQRKVSTRMCD